MVPNHEVYIYVDGQYLSLTELRARGYEVKVYRNTVTQTSYTYSLGSPSITNSIPMGGFKKPEEPKAEKAHRVMKETKRAILGPKRARW